MAYLIIQNVNSFNVKVVSLASGNVIELQGGQKDICIPQGQIAVNQLYDVVVYASNWKYIHRSRHTVLIANKPSIDVEIEYVLEC